MTTEHHAAVYTLDESEEVWWCNSHQRRATHTRSNAHGETHCCDPKLGGILLPCIAVNLTGLVEIEEEVDPCIGCMGDKEWGPQRNLCIHCPKWKSVEPPPRI